MVQIYAEANFDDEILKASQLAFIDFYADWCGPCKMMAPVVEELSEDYSGKVLFGKINVDENQNLAQRYGVMSIPTFLVIKDGEVVEKLVGGLSKEQLVEVIDKNM
jgi:thioredoxin 1